jgi:ADP-L-glycero-D-manno-heptose 6-epimerase
MTALSKALPDRPTESADSVEARANELFTAFRSHATR